MSDNVNPFDQSSGQPAQSAPTTSPSVSPFDRPVTSQTGATPNAPTAPKKKGHGKLIAGVIGGVLVVAAIIVAVILFMTMGKPSAEDYEAAYDAAIDLTNTVSDVIGDVDFNDDDATEDDMKSMADRVISAVDTGQGEIDELGKMTAIANDEEAKQIFDEFNSKYGELSTSVKNLMNDFKQMAPVTAVMLEISDISYSDMDDYAAMANIYQRLADTAKSTTIDNADLKKAVDNIADASAAYANYFQQAAGGTYPDYDIVSDASDLYYDAQDILSDVFSASDLYDLGNDVDDVQRDLADYLWDKYTELDK